MRRRYIHCNDCKRLVLVAGEPRKGDFTDCTHRFAREPITPTVYYINAEGKRLYPWSSDPIPKNYTDLGYQRVELTGIGEIRKFEKEVAREMQSQHSRVSEDERRRYEEARSQRHSDLRQEMRDFDDFHQSLAREAMEQEDRGYSQRYDSEFLIGAYN